MRSACAFWKLKVGDVHGVMVEGDRTRVLLPAQALKKHGADYNLAMVKLQGNRLLESRMYKNFTTCHVRYNSLTSHDKGMTCARSAAPLMHQALLILTHVVMRSIAATAHLQPYTSNCTLEQYHASPSSGDDIIPGKLMMVRGLHAFCRA